MTVRLFGCILYISPVFMGMVTILMMVDTTGMMGIMLTAMLLHEIGHLLFMAVFHCLPTAIWLLPFEINMVNSRPPAKIHQRLLISLGGIAVNLLAYFLFPSPFGIMNGALAVFQLLPLYSMDGYQLLELCLSRFSFGSAATKCVSVITAGVALAFGVGLLVTSQNPMLLLFAVYMIVLGMKENR